MTDHGQEESAAESGSQRPAGASEEVSPFDASEGGDTLLQHKQLSEETNADDAPPSSKPMTKKEQLIAEVNEIIEAHSLSRDRVKDFTQAQFSKTTLLACTQAQLGHVLEIMNADPDVFKV